MGTEKEVTEYLRERSAQQQHLAKQRDLTIKLKQAKDREAMREREAGSVTSKAHATVRVPRKTWSRWEILQSYKDKGRPTGMTGGTYVGDTAAVKQSILLCGQCKHGFDWKKRGYYSVSHYDHIYAIGRCDVCKGVSDQMHLYLHETHIGLSWTPRATLAQQRRKAIIVGG